MMRTLTLVLALAFAAPAAAQDAINLPAAVIHKSPADIADWPITVHLTGLTEDPRNGFALTFDQQLPDRWKWASNPANPAENYQYTVWMFVQIDGAWHGAGFVEMWQGRPMTNGALPAIFAFNNNAIGFTNWWGDPRRLWDDMSFYVPKPGDVIGMLVSAGNARLTGGVTSVRERSNVVTFALPGNDTGVWSFSPATTGPAPLPPSVPAPAGPAPTPTLPPPTAPLPQPTPTVDLSQLTALIQQELALQQDTNAKVTHIDAEVKTFGQQFSQVLEFTGKYIAPAVAAWITAHQLAKP